MADVYRSYTRAEKVKRARLIMRGARQVIGGADALDPKLERRIDQIDARAEDRGAREANALFDQHDRAQNELATARAAERAARGPERTAARDARREAERRARQTESAIRRAGLA